MSEILITKNSDRRECKNFFESLIRGGGRVISESDVGQFDASLDQIYIDMNWEGAVITLHLEHYLGIFLQSDTLSEEQLRAILEKMRAS